MSRPVPRRVLEVWRSFREAYGERFAITYGAEPPELWLETIEDHDAATLRKAVRRTISAHPSHPPTLGEFEAQIRETIGANRTISPGPPMVRDEIPPHLVSLNLWFLKRAFAYRLVHATRDELARLHAEGVRVVLGWYEAREADGDDEATFAVLDAWLDGELEQIYPADELERRRALAANQARERRA